MTAGKVIKDLTMPISMRDIHSWMRASGIPAGTSLAALEFFGMAVQHHEGGQARRRKFKRDRRVSHRNRLGVIVPTERTKRGDVLDRKREAVAWFTKEGITRRELGREYDRYLLKRFKKPETRRAYRRRFNIEARKIR